MFSRDVFLAIHTLCFQLYDLNDRGRAGYLDLTASRVNISSPRPTPSEPDWRDKASISQVIQDTLKSFLKTSANPGHFIKHVIFLFIQHHLALSRNKLCSDEGSKKAILSRIVQECSVCAKDRVDSGWQRSLLTPNGDGLAATTDESRFFDFEMDFDFDVFTAPGLEFGTLDLDAAFQGIPS